MLQGSLDTVTIEDIFQLFSISKKSGELHLEKETSRGSVYFFEGEIYYATVKEEDGIGALLVKSGILEPEQWREVLTKTGEGVSQGDGLLTLDGVDAEILEIFVREWIEDTVFKLLQWETGEFHFLDEVHALGPVWVFPVPDLLEEAKRRLGEWKQLQERIASVAMGVELLRELPEDRQLVELKRDEWRLVASLTPGISIEELAGKMGETEFRICQVLDRMLGLGVIDLVNEEKLAVIRDLMHSENAGSIAAFAGPIFTDPESNFQGAALGADGRDVADFVGAGGSEETTEEVLPPFEDMPGDLTVNSANMSFAELAAEAEAEAVVQTKTEVVSGTEAAPEAGVFARGANGAENAQEDVSVVNHGSDDASFSSDAPAEGGAPDGVTPRHLEKDLLEAVQEGKLTERNIEGGNIGADLDKSLVLRLIAGVKNL